MIGNAYNKILDKKSDRRGSLRDLHINERAVLKCIIQK
jgi:hypothetical protein